MIRNAMEDLIRWKASEERKPMVLKGARQVGKTWLMKEFGKNYYTSYVYFNFDEEDDLKSIFETSELPRLKEVGASQSLWLFLRSLVLMFPPDLSGYPYSCRRVHFASTV